MSIDITKNTTSSSSRTSGCLAEQSENANQKIVSARMSRGSGYEVTAVGGIEIRSWSPAKEASIEIVRRALEAALDPGNDAAIEVAVEQIGREAKLTRSAVREHVVDPQVGEAELKVKEILARGVAGINTDNAVSACEQIIRRAYETVSSLDERVQRQIEMLLSEERLLSGVEQATRSSQSGLATTAAALGRVERMTQQESEKIDKDLRESADAAARSEQRLRVVAIEAGRHTLFGKSAAAGRVVREVSVTLPTLPAERLAQIYLPGVRQRLPAVAAACRHHRERISDRLGHLRRDRERVLTLAAEAARELDERGRRWVVGAPRSEVERRAKVEKLVDAVYPTVESQLRAILLTASKPKIVDELLELAVACVDAQSLSVPVDQAVLADRDPAKVAVLLDAKLNEIDVPVALVPGADRAKLREWRCRVICAAPGSRLAAALVEHAGYAADTFSFSATAEIFEAIVVQPGVTLENTRVFHDGTVAYDDELSDPESAPIQAIADGAVVSSQNLQGKAVLAASYPKEGDLYGAPNRAAVETLMPNG